MGREKEELEGIEDDMWGRCMKLVIPDRGFVIARCDGSESRRLRIVAVNFVL
uniref:Uncharacterized protein n=1 Tax=Oryza sativa subsp. japonica TaxID=39947 RepID=Q6Z6U4_ORYSJ|nr:hypothetical protein [Oryza sativa Japonica Group]